MRKSKTMLPINGKTGRCKNKEKCAVNQKRRRREQKSLNENEEFEQRG